MRTTLDIDDDVLSAAKELALRDKTTAGQVLSDLARKALTTPTELEAPVGPDGLVLRNGWYVLPRRSGAIVTSEMVARLMDEADIEDAGVGKGE
jgi:hypothetical protein